MRASGLVVSPPASMRKEKGKKDAWYRRRRNRNVQPGRRIAVVSPPLSDAVVLPFGSTANAHCFFGGVANKMRSAKRRAWRGARRRGNSFFCFFQHTRTPHHPLSFVFISFAYLYVHLGSPPPPTAAPLPSPAGCSDGVG